MLNDTTTNSCSRSVYPVENIWSESSLTYSNLDPLPSEKVGTDNEAGVGVWAEADVTKFIQQYVIGNVSDYNGFLINLDKDNVEYDCRIASSENSDQTLRPKLTILYNSDNFVEVQKPNGGEIWRQYYSYDISWMDNISEDVNIELIKGSAVVDTIAKNISVSPFSWTIPLSTTPSSDYKIKISSSVTDTINDMSDDVFEIEEVHIVDSFPYVITFDDFTNGADDSLSHYWTQEYKSDDFNWTVKSGATPSNTQPDDWWNHTGASGDHTNGTIGQYLYTEATGNSPSKKAEIQTPVFDTRNHDNLELSFWYHMWAEQEASWSNFMGHLYLDINLDGTWHNGVFHKVKDQGNQWNQEVINLSSYSGLVQVRFRGVTGSDFASDMAIDDFSIYGPSTNISQSKSVNLGVSFSKVGSTLKLVVPVEKLGTHASVKLFNMQGKIVKTLFDNTMDKQVNLFNVSSKNAVASGFYLCRLEMGSYCKSILLSIKK